MQHDDNSTSNHYNRLTWLGYNLHQTDDKTGKSTVQDCGTPESDKREDSDKSEPNSKRVDKKGKVKNCPVEPFLETLRLLEEWL